MSDTPSDWRDDETLPAASDAVDEIRAEAARIQQRDAFRPDVDPTAPIAEAANTAEPAAVAFDPEVDPTTPLAMPGHDVEPPTGASLIEGKTPPAAETNYWTRDQIAEQTTPGASSGKGPVPTWFIASSLLAVLMAVGLVVLVLWALSG